VASIAEPNATARNHPLAFRMGAIAFLTQNFGVGALYGAYGLMMIPLEAKLHVSRTISALGVPLAGIGMALLAPLVGGLASRMSLRLVMMAGALMATLGFALIALSSSVTLFLIAYAALIGPGICLTAVIPPQILTTRWFAVGRGRALGIVNGPLMMALLPLVAAPVLQNWGLDTLYLLLAGMMTACFLIQFLVIDYPPSATDPSGMDSAGEAAAHPGASASELLGSAIFWKLTIGICLQFSSIVMIGSHLAPMAIGWGVSQPQAASLLGLYAGMAVIGSPLFGWIGDRIGGRAVLTILAVDLAILFALLLLHPSFPLLLVLAALMGLHIASVPGSFALAVTEQFGAESFGRAYGIAQLVNLPFSFGSVPLAAWIFERTGSYAEALILHVGLLLLSAVLVLIVRAPAARS
jgi:MFS family permease